MTTHAFYGLVASLVLLPVTAPVLAASGGYAQDAWAPKEFPIGFWCGPPDSFTTVERYQEIREAGFTFITPPCTWGGPHGDAATVERNRNILEVCRKTGFKAFLADNRMPHRVTGEADAKARLDAIIAEYSKHPAFAGYSVGDEPGAAAFDGLAEVVAYLREKDPKHPAYINLFPFAPGAAWGAPSYRDYLKQFIGKVQPFVLSYDHYHFRTGGDGPFFIRNLAEARATSQEAGLPFWNIVLLTQHADYRNLTLGEIRYEAMQTLAYGAKGLKWFTYWEPQDAAFQWTHAAINLDGTRDAHFDMLKTVNQEVLAFGKELLRATSEDVYHFGAMPDGGNAPALGDPVQVSGKADVTVGLFRDDRGSRYAFLASGDYRKPVALDLSVRTPAARLRRLDASDRRWKKLEGAREDSGETKMVLELPPGGGALFRW